MKLRLVSLFTLVAFWNCPGISAPGFKPSEDPRPEDNSGIFFKKAALHQDSESKLCYFGKSMSEIPDTQERHRVPNVETGSVVEYGLSKQSKQILLYDPGCSIKYPIYTTMGTIGGGIGGGFFGVVAGTLFDALIGIKRPGEVFGVCGLLGGAAWGGCKGGYKGYCIADEPRSESILGSTDRRIKVSNTKDWPWRVQGHLEFNFGEKSTYIGSGTLVGPKHVLTAGHNLYHHDDKDPSKSVPVSSISFYPGISGTNIPWSARGDTMLVHPRYKNARNYAEQQESDMGMIILDKPLGTKLGYFGTRAFEDADSTVHITGYPGDKCNGREMYTMSGLIKNKTSDRLFYDIDTTPGQSGSSVYTWSEEKKEGTCVAVHAYGSGGTEKYNSGTRLNTQNFSIVQNWISTHS